MGGGGKTGTTTQTVAIPPAVLRNYNYVNRLARQAARTPFEAYSGELVAPINVRQYGAMRGIDEAGSLAQPYFQQAGQMALGAAGPVQMGELGQAQIEKYLNPYTQNVVEATQRAQAQANAQQYQQLYGNAITQGAFGGDRAGIGAANLAYQQNLANQQQIAELYRQGYTQALGVAGEQQLRDLTARQQDQARMLQAAQQYAGVGAGAQEAALQGFQSQLGAGTLEQQTQQALNMAQYQQFLQEKGYPFQTAQFLANIAMGTGALSGSTTTTQQPYSFFSDERMKEDMRPVGKTFDGQTIYSYKYKGEPATRMGLIAQEVERHHPEAVGEAGGMKTVDYDAATRDAADRGRFYRGGLVAEGGAVHPEMAGLGYASGGSPIGGDMAAILESHRGMFGGLAGPGQAMGEGSPYGGAGGPYGASLGQLGRYEMLRPGDVPEQQESGLSQALGAGSSIANIYQGFSGKSKATDGTVKDTGQPVGKTVTKETPAAATTGQPTADAAAPADGRGLGERAYDFAAKGLGSLKEDIGKGFDYVKNQIYSDNMAYGGGLGYARGGAAGYAVGGLLPYSSSNSYVPPEVLEPVKPPEPPKPASAPGQGTSDFQNLLGTAGSIAGIYAAFSGSDRRMKEDIRPVGKTFDGQTVYSYRYKGEPGVQMGLMAQEVEHQHPDAVAHDHRGLKMVDYDRATSDAAERGKFYAGGLARHGYQTDGAVTDDPLEAALQAQVDADRKRALGAFKMPRPGPRIEGEGVANRIPTGELPEFARPVPAQDTVAPNVSYGIPESPYGKSPARQTYEKGVDVATALGKFAGDVVPLAGQTLKFTQSLPFMNPAERSQAATDLGGQYRAFGQNYGLVPTGGEAAEPSFTSALINPRALPEAAAKSMSVGLAPIKQAWETAPTAGEPVPAATGVAPPAATTAAPTPTAAGLAAPTITVPARPVERPRLDAVPPVNGSIYDPETYRQMTMARESGGNPLARNPASTASGLYGHTEGTWNGIRQKYPDANILPFGQGRDDPAQQELVQRLLTEDNAKLLQNAGIRPTNATLATAHRYGLDVATQINSLPSNTTIEAVVARMPEAIRDKVRADFASEGVRTVGDALVRQQQGWLQSGSGLAAPTTARSESAPTTVQAIAGTQRAPVDTAGIMKDTAAPQEAPQALPGSLKSQGGWFERNEDWLVPLLAGLGTMASSNSRFLGSAILQGIGGAAQTYPAVQEKLASLQGKRIENQQKFLELAQSDFYSDPSGRSMVYLPTGPVLYGEWVRMGKPPTINQLSFLQALGMPTEGAAGARPAAAPAGGISAELPPDVVRQIDQNIAINEALPGEGLNAIAERNNRYLDTTSAAATAARNMMAGNRKMIDTLAKADPSEMGPTIFPQIRNIAAANLDALARQFGVTGVVDDRGVVNQEVLRKLQGSDAFRAASAAQQNSIQGLSTALASTPGPEMTMSANMNILATALVESKRLLDAEKFARDLQAVATERTGDPRFFDLSNADRLFREANPDSNYQQAQDALRELLMTEGGPQRFSEFIRGRYTPEQIDEAFTSRGLPPMSGYFVGGL